MTEEPTYGSQFLESLDKLAGKAVFRYAQRKAFREMNQDAVAKQLKRLGYEYFKTATDCSPEELAELLARQINVSASPNTETLALLNNINLLLFD